MKKIYFSLFLLLAGCGSNNLNVFKQPSISTQKMDAQNAWDELDGKPVTLKKVKPSTSSISSVNKITPQATKVAKSILEVSDNIPDWFYSPPKSDTYFYGAGEGIDVKQAQAAALDSIAREIQTTISSNLNISQGYSSSNGNSSFYKSVRNDIHTQVKKINFTNIEIMKTVKVGNNIYLLVRINKLKLFNSLKTQFEILDSKIDNEIKVSKNYSLLDQLITLNKLEPKISEALSKATILNTLNPNFDIKPYINKYNSYLNQKTKLLHQLTFSVSSNDIFSQKLIEVLNQKGYKIASNSNIQIKVLKQIRNSTPMGMAVARITINIQVIAKNKILSSTSLEVKGISNTPSQAIAKAANNFKAKLLKANINKLLGFE